MHNSILTTSMYTGIPQQPTLHNTISTSPGVAQLEVSTGEAGVEDGRTIEFVIKAEMCGNGLSALFLHEITNYIDSTVTTLTISDLLPGAEYQFTVRVQNEFGTSEFSEKRMLLIKQLLSGSSTPIGTDCIELFAANLI